jgi:hypothetical protein
MLLKLNGLRQLLVCVQDANLLGKTYTLQPDSENFTVSGQNNLVPKCSHTINICYSFICFLLKSIFNIRSTTISPPNKFFTDLIHVMFLHQNLKQPPILSICSQPTMSDMMPLVYTFTIYGYFPLGSQV